MSSSRSCIQSDVWEKFKTSSTRSCFWKTLPLSPARSCTSTVARAPVIDQNGAAAGGRCSCPGTPRGDKGVVRPKATRMPEQQWLLKNPFVVSEDRDRGILSAAERWLRLCSVTHTWMPDVMALEQAQLL